MFKNNIKKSITILIMLISLSTTSSFLNTANAIGVTTSASISESTINPTIIDVTTYKLE